MDGRDRERGADPDARGIPSHGSVLGIVVKRPRPGGAKTRLAAAIGQDGAAALAEAFLIDLAGRFAGSPRWDLAVSFDPPGEESYFARIAPSALRIPQEPGDLGARLRGAFDALFAAGYRKAALLGADVPDLPARAVERAFAYLDASDIAIGPACDGGYYLIGLRAPAPPSLFEGIAWSTERVLDETLGRAAEAGRTVERLAPWPDIDRPEDLRALAERLSRERAPATFDAIARLRGEGLI
ncbi:MAG: TIGR04282 family arsenosugar biosynthesis glycosyltransferase [Planctomycetes bacterium]|nr:TIGR04282 family arsenosugar biosynthesis glycosyltransferase [Planctomycetota bacterium]